VRLRRLPGRPNRLAQSILSEGIVGHTGFVGSNLCRQRRFDGMFNSTNIKEIRGLSFERLVFAGAQAKKWWANQHPEEDWAGIKSALAEIGRATVTHAILISTIDVLPEWPGADESCDGEPGSAYGFNRLRLERAFLRLFPSVTIVRLPALFGNGLKKNVLFDLLNRNMLEKVNPASRFQYYDLDRLWSDIETAMANDLSLVHLVTEPVATAEIVDRAFRELPIGADPSPMATYDHRTVHDRLFGGRDGYIYDRAEVLRRLDDFIEQERMRMPATGRP
jgi:nucleoside-diphosphate-sugar epimerase